MSTTNLFVELIVIGLGAAIWATLFTLAALGLDHEALNPIVEEPVLVTAVIPIVYLLGIVTDRLADGLAQILRMEKKRQTDYPGGSAQYHKDRALVLAKSEAFGKLYEYSRSRQRICRGWALNSLVVLVASYVYLWGTPGTGTILLVLTVALIATSAGCWLSWESMSNTELKRIEDQADTIREHLPT
jgi:hypothetical protein